MRYNRLYKDNDFLTPTTYTQELSEYAEQLSYEDIPPEVVERAKMILLQTIGAALAAKGTPIAEKAGKMAREANGGPGGPTTVWGMDGKMAAVNAALVLGTISDALDWEDCSWTGHPAAGVIPCAWLAAEEKHKSGKGTDCKKEKSICIFKACEQQHIMQNRSGTKCKKRHIRGKAFFI